MAPTDFSGMYAQIVLDKEPVVDNPLIKAIEFLHKEIEANNKAYLDYGTRGAATHMMLHLIAARDDFNNKCLAGIDVLHDLYMQQATKEFGKDSQKVLDMVKKVS